MINKIPFYFYFYQVNKRRILFSEIVSPHFCSISPLNLWLFYPLENLSIVRLAYKNRGSDSQIKIQRQKFDTTFKSPLKIFFQSFYTSSERYSKGVGILSPFCAKEARDIRDFGLFYPGGDRADELLAQPWAEPRNVLKKRLSL